MNTNEINLYNLTGELNNVVVLNLNSHDNKYNLLSDSFIIKLHESIDNIKSNENINLLIIKSNQKNIFCAGGHLKEQLNLSHDRITEIIETLKNIIKAIYELPCPTIAAIDGHAIGGGLEICLATDIRVVSSNAKLGLTETTLGNIPGGGGTQLLPKLIPINIAKELIFTGKLIDGNTAESINLANYCVEQNENGDAAFLKAMELAKEINKNSSLAVKSAKFAINKSLELNYDMGFVIETFSSVKLLNTHDRNERLKVFFERKNSK